MSKKILFRLVLALVLVALTGCATTAIPPRVSSEDCLVLIPTLMFNPDKSPAVRVFKLRFTEPVAPQEVSSKAIDYLAVLVPNDQVRLTFLISGVRGARVTGDATSDKVDLALPYAPGQVVVWEKSFVQAIKRSGVKATSSSSGFEDTTADLKAEVLRLFRASPQAAPWLD